VKRSEKNKKGAITEQKARKKERTCWQQGSMGKDRQWPSLLCLSYKHKEPLNKKGHADILPPNSIPLSILFTLLPKRKRKEEKKLIKSLPIATHFDFTTITTL